MRRRGMTATAAGVVGVLGVMLAVTAGSNAGAAPTTSPKRSHQAAVFEDANLRLAARAVEAQALAGGALRKPMGRRTPPAVVLFKSDEAILRKAKATDPSLKPTNTRHLVGPEPYYFAHELKRRPGHSDVTATHTLRRFSHSVHVAGSAGLGTTAFHHWATPAKFQQPDGVYVDPRLPSAGPLVADVALRAALGRLGQPYVWAAAGPTTFDCSGLTRYAYARAGILLTHFSGAQWNQGRLIAPAKALPGDLILFGHHIFHVAIYVGAGWMLQAPFTGHYVDVAPVRSKVAGVVRP